MRAIQIDEVGGPEVLVSTNIDLPEPGSNQVCVEVEAVGVNFIDVYHRTGAYPLQLPFIPGLEGGGRIVALGEGCDDFSVGDRVAWATSIGSYAESALIGSEKLIKLPSEISFDSATALLLQGLTAHYLTHSTFPLQPGQTALVHAAAGGVGRLLLQIAKLLGVRSIGTVSTPEKAEMARSAGADDVILYEDQDFEAEVLRMTDGQGVEVVYESVGRSTFDKSLNCLKPCGYLVLFGQSSGAVGPIDPQVLSAKGSLFLTRPTLFHYASTKEVLQARAADLFSWLQSGDVTIHVDRTLPLSKAADAHRALEARETTGKVLLKPELDHV